MGDYIDSIVKAFSSSEGFFGNKTLSRVSGCDVGDVMGSDGMTVVVDQNGLILGKVMDNYYTKGGSVGQSSISRGASTSITDANSLKNFSNAKVTISGQVFRECPPNQVNQYKKVITPLLKDLRDTLAGMVKNSFLNFTVQTDVRILGTVKLKEVNIEVWFEDDYHFHVYKDSQRVFRSREAKKVSQFIENDLI